MSFRVQDWFSLVCAMSGLFWAVQDRDWVAATGFFGWFIESLYVVRLRTES